MAVNPAITTASHHPPVPSTQLHTRATTIEMVNRGRNLYVSSVKEATRLVYVTDPKERLSIVKRDNLCFNSLARHKVTQCTSKFTCRECKKRHHTSLCHAFLTETTQSQPDQQTSALPNAQAPATDNAAFTTMTPAPLSALYTSVCLLKTAIAEVSSATTTTEGNILFDEGAQCSFIAQALADELCLHPTHRETISVSSFGGQVSSSRSLEVATLFVHTLNSARIPIRSSLFSSWQPPSET